MPSVRRDAVAVALGLAAFGFRFLTTRNLTNDHYMHLAWAQQLLLGDVPGRDFVEPGMPLQVLLSAAAQDVSPGPFSESVLSCLMLAVAAAVIYLVTVRLTGSSAVAIGASLVAIALQPRLYAYPKVLVPAVAALTFQRYVDEPSGRRLAIMGASIAAAFLFRHDLGLYAGVALMAGLVVLHGSDWKRGATAVAQCGAVVALVLLPYTGFVTWNEGLAEHVRSAIEFTKGEVHQLRYPWPRFPAIAAGRLDTWSYLDSSAFLYYLAHLLVVLAPLLLVVRRAGLRRAETAAIVSVTAMQALYLLIVLRHPVYSRIQDLAGVLPVVGAWAATEGARSLGGAMSRRGVRARVVALGIAVVLAATTGVAITSVWILGKMGEQLRETRAQDGWRKMREVATVIRKDGSEWPWEAFWPNAGSMPPVIAYLNECTDRSDRIFITWPAPEYYFFARRPFAGGHALIIFRGFATTRDEDLILRRLERDRVHVVLINETRRGGFASIYPRVDEWLRTRYSVVERFQIYDDSQIALGVRSDVSPARSYGGTAWPCGFNTGPELPPSQ